MRRALRWTVGAALVAAVALGVAALSRAPYEPRGAERSLLRLSWRVRGERVEECRQLSTAEIEALPVHMRRTEICEGAVLPYHLTVELDGRAVLRHTVHAAGAREDRPLYVFAELPLAVGTHGLAVRFVRDDVERDDDGEEDDERDDVEHDDDERDDVERDDDEHAGATPARLELRQVFRILPGEVALVTYDADLRTLVTRTPAP